MFVRNQIALLAARSHSPKLSQSMQSVTRILPVCKLSLRRFVAKSILHHRQESSRVDDRETLVSTEIDRSLVGRCEFAKLLPFVTGPVTNEAVRRTPNRCPTRTG